MRRIDPRIDKQAHNTHVASNTAGIFYVIRATQQYKSCVFCVIRAASI
jgi:hypothetical protein